MSGPDAKRARTEATAGSSADGEEGEDKSVLVTLCEGVVFSIKLSKLKKKDTILNDCEIADGPYNYEGDTGGGGVTGGGATLVLSDTIDMRTVHLLADKWGVPAAQFVRSCLVDDRPLVPSGLALEDLIPLVQVKPPPPPPTGTTFY